MTSKRILSAVIAAALTLTAVSLSGCQLKGHSPEDYYVSPYATHDTAEQSDTSGETEQSYITDNESKKDESKKAESKAEESKAESKKAESKAESKKSESKVESKKAESKSESKSDGSVESRAESQTESKKEEASSDKKEEKEESKIYKDMVSLIKDTDVLGYTVTKLPGSEDDHLIIYYGKHIKKEDTDTSNLIILDPEGYAKELEEKENERREKEEGTKLYSVYKISGDRCTPEGDIDGYFTTAYISPNTNTVGLYYTKGEDWKYGLIEMMGSSAVINYSYEGTIEDNGGSIPPMPGNEVQFSKPDNFDLIKSYK